MPVFFYVLLFSIKLSAGILNSTIFWTSWETFCRLGILQNASCCFFCVPFFVHWFIMALGQLVQQFIFPCKKCWIELNCIAIFKKKKKKLNCIADEYQRLDSSFDLAAWALEETTGENEESEGKAWITLSVTSSREEAKSHWGKQLWFNGCFEFRKIHLSFKKKSFKCSQEFLYIITIWRFGCVVSQGFSSKFVNCIVYQIFM